MLEGYPFHTRDSPPFPPQRLSRARRHVGVAVRWFESEPNPESRGTRTPF